MEKKLNNLLKNKISKEFVAKLENKLMGQYKPKANRFMFWRYSLAGLSLIILIAASMFFVNPFSSRNNIVANALKYYRTLEDAPGIFYAKYKISITGQEGLESAFGNEYTEESWIGDNGERLLKIHGNNDGIMLTTADGRSFSDYPWDNHSPSTTISCVVNEQKKGNLVGRTNLTVKSEDYSQYQTSSEIIDNSPIENSQEPAPEEDWQSDGTISKEILAKIKQDPQFKVESVTLEGKDVFKITTEKNGDGTEMYFEKETFMLKKEINYPVEHPEFKFSTEYLEVKNITEISPEALFSPEKYKIQEVYEDAPFIEEAGCYFPDGKKMTEEEMSKLLLSLPDSAKKEIECSELYIKERLKMKERPTEEERIKMEDRLGAICEQ
jgi:hypothetical protein